ncbi:MAG: DUF5714 domain-containing protein [Candidatus Adiutrix sp.]|jgi:hypothetical protein|nr:DUF5714 domain-containing protein [Candidatus Adiutrix sp.]
MSGNELEKACLLCGQPLVYSQEAHEAECSGCGRSFATNAECEDGHFICDECHGAKSRPVIFYYCANTEKRDPYAIANEIMQNPTVHMHGPEHHVLIGSALLAAYRNCGGRIDLTEALKIMSQRGSQVPGGICGLWGNCGAGTSAGIFTSIITGSTPLAGNSWKLSNLMTAECLKNIAGSGGPRCCKRDGFIAIKTAVPFIAENVGVKMDLTEKIECHFSERNKECLKKQCLFFVT